VWHAITDFLLKAHASGLAHDAVIEIMIALLGLMLAVLTLVLGIFAAIVAILGFFGFETIRKELIKKASDVAGTVAKKLAKEVATGIAHETLKEIREQAQASGLTASQATPEGIPLTRKHKTGRTKATTDKGLENN